MEYPTSMYPQSKPLEAGSYLVHDDILKKWIVARWSNKYNNWEGRPSVNMFIPFRLAEKGGIMPESLIELWTESCNQLKLFKTASGAYRMEIRDGKNTFGILPMLKDELKELRDLLNKEFPEENNGK